MCVYVCVSVCVCLVLCVHFCSGTTYGFTCWGYTKGGIQTGRDAELKSPRLWCRVRTVYCSGRFARRIQGVVRDKSGQQLLFEEEKLSLDGGILNDVLC